MAGKNSVAIKVNPEFVELLKELDEIEKSRGREKNTYPELTLLAARRIKSMGGWRRD